MPVPFTEKYRPKSLDELNGNKEVIECLKSLDINNLPNMLFYGPPGTGKTTAVMALLKDLPFQNILTLNASDQRGIDTVRNEIKEFALIKLKGPKVVILDEADSMSKEAQGALRRIIEDYKNTRFCFICNYYKKIIEPIVSRCTRFRFAPVNDMLRIKEICHREGIPFDEAGIATINRFSDGDMRKVMNDIQGMIGCYTSITKENVLEFFGMINNNIFDEIFKALLEENFDGCLLSINRSQVDCADLITNITNILVNTSLPNKMEILKQLADIEQKLTIGCSELVQLNALIGAFISKR
ncbi:Subunit of heteropentameric Replication factor C (RF-C) [Glugoides intestinalis]